MTSSEIKILFYFTSLYNKGYNLEKNIYFNKINSETRTMVISSDFRVGQHRDDEV